MRKKSQKCKQVPIYQSSKCYGRTQNVHISKNQIFVKTIANLSIKGKKIQDKRMLHGTDPNGSARTSFFVEWIS